jgi:hypothetical protein
MFKHFVVGLSLIYFISENSLADEVSEAKGLEVAKIIEEAGKKFDSDSSDMEMVLVDAYGSSVSRSLRGETLEGSDSNGKSLLEFISPVDVKGTKLLTHSHKVKDDEQWLFLPSLKRKKRISGGARSGSFMGSEFSFEDLSNGSVEKFNFDLINETESEWTLKRVSKKRSGYSKQVMKISKKYSNPTEVEYYNRRGDLLKVAAFSDWKKFIVGKKVFFKAMKIHMKNKLTNKQSIFSWSNRSLGGKVKSSKFNPARLR